MNVLGFNSGIVRHKGIEVNGYDIPVQRTFRGTPGIDEQRNACEDGMMAYRLIEAGGKVAAQHAYEAKVWTSDRRIEIDGGLKKAFIIRAKRYLVKRKPVIKNAPGTTIA